jgi:hypothetical protein
LVVGSNPTGPTSLLMPIDLFRSFQPMRNPIGFGAADFIELAFAIVLVVLAIGWRPWLQRFFAWLAPKTGWCMVVLALLPIALRLALTVQYPIPTPYVSDDFSYVLAADTLRHFRLGNPTHPLHQFFETFFVLQEPSYSSIFPLGQAIVLAVGWTLLGHPWAGVALSIGALCALSYWMLRAWTTPVWALAGGLLAVIQFGPINQWMNSYWGGAVSASAGCLVFGALPRLRESGHRRDAIWLGIGLALQMLTRPFESIFLVLSVGLYFLWSFKTLARAIPVIALAVLPAALLILAQNKQVTGSWTTLPYSVSRFQYGVPASFTTQPNPTPHRDLTREQQLDYQIQSDIHGKDTDTVGRYFERLMGRVRNYRFFFLTPLYLALPAFLILTRQYRFAWVVITALIFALGTNFYPYFYSHYIAAITCLFVLMSVAGLERLYGWRPDAARIIIFFCVAHFLFWYALLLCGSQDFSLAMRRYQTWDAINQGDPEGRIAVRKQLEESGGKQLVFVRYQPRHTFQEWVHNAADIDGSRIVWARDLGEEENQKLLRYYPDRKAWLLEPDFRPPRLTQLGLDLHH